MIGITRRDARPAAADAFDVLAIIFVFLMIATSFVAFTFYSKLQSETAKWNRAFAEDQLAASEFERAADQTVDTLKDDIKAKDEDLRKLSRILGFYRGEEAAANVQTAVATLNQVYAEHGDGGGKEAVKLADLSGEKGPDFPISKMIAKLEGKIATVIGDATRGTKVLEEELAKLEGALAGGSDGGKIEVKAAETLAKEAEKIKTLDAKRKELTSVRESRHSRVLELTASRKKASEEVDEARKAKELIQTSVFEVDQFWKAKNAELKQVHENVMEGVTTLVDQVEKMTETKKDKDQARPDGEMLSSNFRTQMGWINLTRNDRLLTGMKFEVFRYLKGGKEELRGEVQVIQVGDKMSKVRVLNRYYKGTRVEMDNLLRQKDYVLREFELDPLGTGDQIRNRFFDKEEKRVFVFAGKLTGPPGARAKYLETEARKLIEELGDEVHKRVTEQTNYIVLGEGYAKDKNFSKAAEYGIPVMSERELMQVLGKY